MRASRSMCSGPASAAPGERSCAALAPLAAARPGRSHPAAAPRQTAAVPGPVAKPKTPFKLGRSQGRDACWEPVALSFIHRYVKKGEATRTWWLTCMEPNVLKHLFTFEFCTDSHSSQVPMDTLICWWWEAQGAVCNLLQTAGNEVAQGLTEGALQPWRWIFGYKEERTHGVQLC